MADKGNGTDLYRDTDYTTEDFLELVKSGAIPKSFTRDIDACVIEVYGGVRDAMKQYPKSQLGHGWLQKLGEILHMLEDKFFEAGKTVYHETQTFGAEETADEQIVIAYHNTEELGPMIGMKASKLNTLLHWAFTEHPELSPWILKDPEDGYIVADPIVLDCLEQNRRFDRFLKDVVLGKVEIVMPEPPSEE